jgi:hypothetical protein
MIVSIGTATSRADPCSRTQSRHTDAPATTLGMSFALLGRLISNKGEDDLRRYADFVRRASKLAGEDPSYALSRLARDEHRRFTKKYRHGVSIV